MFESISSITNDHALSAATGSAFKDAIPSYENDGNENTTTRAGLRVRKISVIAALQHNLGIDVAGHLTDAPKFVAALNKILPTENALKADDLANLDNVVISMQPGSKEVLTDLAPDSKQQPIVDLHLRFTLTAQAGKTIGKQNVDRLVLEGLTKVKLTDYRRVDQSTLAATKTPAHVTIKGDKPKSATYATLTQALDGYFDITDPSFATTLFPIWNVDPTTDRPMFVDKASGEPVKHSLNSDQIDTLAAMYTGLDGKGWGDFGKARIKRAVQKVSFVASNPAGGPKSTKNGYEGNFDVTINFIQHWSWNKAPYTERAADFTLKNVPIRITFNK
ncbi:hypothetical protein EBB59_00965 [Lysobacter pythonis]|uniref:Uncharacterized protein n=2 Tax=Solilutibacter pythonis TaxID=2483112 RepID=A0A3M2I3K3_9GAMM|nr:hypothetical protein EBB59_00965 [Lysobacter pythonis]